MYNQDFSKIWDPLRWFAEHPEGVPTMDLMLDGSSEHVAHAIRKIGLFGEKFEFDDSVEIIECL